MALRFRRSIRLFQGVHLNVSKGGVSWSFGRPGATVNVGKDGVTRTIGIPGTGISDRTRMIDSPESSSASLSAAGSLIVGAILVLLILAIAAMIYGSWTDPAARTTLGQVAKLMLSVFSRPGIKGSR
jgi:hypothetical protein